MAEYGRQLKNQTKYEQTKYKLLKFIRDAYSAINSWFFSNLQFYTSVIFHF